MTIVTSGLQSTDIDTLACAVAYAELLNLQGIKAIATFGPEYTESVTREIIAWNFSFVKLSEVKPTPQDNYVVVDYSNPQFLPGFVVQEKISKLFDHHYFGFEQDWKKKLGKDSVIEPVGSCASLIWREWERSGMLAQLSKTLAGLLYAAIISNTLDLKAQVTSDLDRQAAADLQTRTGLPADWNAAYYAELEAAVTADPIAAVTKDTRIYEIKSENWLIGQMELWDGKKFALAYAGELQKLLNNWAEKEDIQYGFINIPAIKEGHNYILPLNEQTINKLTARIKLVSGINGFEETEKLFLRKELIRLLSN